MKSKKKSQVGSSTNFIYRAIVSRKYGRSEMLTQEKLRQIVENKIGRYFLLNDIEFDRNTKVDNNDVAIYSLSISDVQKLNIFELAKIISKVDGVSVKVKKYPGSMRLFEYINNPKIK